MTGGSSATDRNLELLARTWHRLTDHPSPTKPGDVAPSTLLPGTIDEPLLRTVDADGVAHVRSNVCPACGSILVERARANLERIRCVDCSAEHGCTDLGPIDSGQWGPLRFASLRPAHSLDELLGPLPSALGNRPVDRAARSETASRDFLVPAPWMAYVEDAISSEGEPLSSWELGMRWPSRWVLVPATIIDVHDWGLSVRAVQRLSARATRVVLETWIWDEAPSIPDVSEAHYATERRVARRARGRASRAHAGREWAPAIAALHDKLAAVVDRPA